MILWWTCHVSNGFYRFTCGGLSGGLGGLRRTRLEVGIRPDGFCALVDAVARFSSWLETSGSMGSVGKCEVYIYNIYIYMYICIYIYIYCVIVYTYCFRKYLGHEKKLQIKILSLRLKMDQVILGHITWTLPPGLPY